VTGAYTRLPGLNFGGKVTVPGAPKPTAPQPEGDKVTGAGIPDSGKIEGTLTGNILRFKWTSDGRKGSGRFVFDKSEMAFSGTYTNSDDPEKVDGVWNGTRKLGGSGGKAPRKP